MKRHIPYGKLSKKKKAELDRKKRGSWGGLNPVTRKPDNPKAYKRSKARSWNEEILVRCAFYSKVNEGFPQCDALTIHSGRV